MEHIRNDREQRAKDAVAWIITISEMAIFLLVWMIFYNSRVFETHRAAGAAVSAVVYFAIYHSAAMLYRAYKISAYPVGETILSQMLAFGLADMVLYIEACLIANRYLTLIPGLIAAIVQILVVTAWAVGAKTWFIKKIPPRKTLVIYGRDDVEEFCHKLERKYGHLFDITKKISCRLPVEEQLAKINENETVLLYETAYGIRTGLMTYLVNEKKTFYITPRISDIVIQGFDKRHLIDTPLLKYQYAKDNRRNCFSKRALDLAVSLTGLLILSPVVLITMLAIKMEDGGDIFFRQKRTGLDGKDFYCLKFRSMHVNKDADRIQATKDDPRKFKFGDFMRKTNIDEFPQFINVFKGSMSLVGPRPHMLLHTQEYSRLIRRYMVRHLVKPGITGWAQVQGFRGETKTVAQMESRVKADIWYVENWTFSLDLRIMWRTLTNMIKHNEENAY